MYQGRITICDKSSEVLYKQMKAIAKINNLRCNFSYSDRGVCVQGIEEDIRLAIKIYKSQYNKELRCELYGHA